MTEVHVSIPHRYATDAITHGSASGRYMFQSLIGTLQTNERMVLFYKYIEFQSLIGTLQTGQNHKSLLYLLLFQSLIGTLQTNNAAPVGSFRDLFQSLIGTLQTIIGVEKVLPIPQVSIPHRYATDF